jgi:hypothetical protein
LFSVSLRNFQRELRAQGGIGSAVNQLIGRIAELRLFVYDVRCNIFHGRKSLADLEDENQNKRIRTYYAFLHGLVSLFFACIDDAQPGNAADRQQPASPSVAGG